MKNPTERFSDRVENYIKYRPSYPQAIIDLLCTECALIATSIVADVGSGTGILSRLFLDHGCRVFGVEPNREMREAAERLLGAYANFVSVNAQAEDTGLPSHSVDFITAGQAFHWFDRDRAKAEFQRILRPNGWCVIAWNERKIESSPFQQAYQTIVREHSKDWERVRHENVTHDILDQFFKPGHCRHATLPNPCQLDFDGVKGRLLSSSYMPNEEDPASGPMVAGLRRAFDQHAENGVVAFDHETVVVYGQFAADTSYESGSS
jgi:SAM-dependent methyltransferase